MVFFRAVILTHELDQLHIKCKSFSSNALENLMQLIMVVMNNISIIVHLIFIIQKHTTLNLVH